MTNDNLKNLIKQGKVNLTATACLGCGVSFKYTHRKKLLCRHCWPKSPEGKAEAKKIMKGYYKRNKARIIKNYLDYMKTENFIRSYLIKHPRSRKYATYKCLLEEGKK